jgi:putative ABC transport system permease protein
VQEAVEGIPGVSLATRVNRMPGTGNAGSHSFVRPDRPHTTGPEPEGFYREVSPGYFRNLGIPLLGGRDFGPGDARGSAPVVIVNRRLQQRYFPGEDAIGKTIRPVYSTTGAALTIVGVVGDQTLGGLDEARPAILYYPDGQSVSPRWTVVVRSDRPGVAEELRKTIRAAAPRLVVGPARQLGAVLQQAPSMFLRRYPVFLLGVFACVALVLACVGIFGVVSFAGRAHPRVRSGWRWVPCAGTSWASCSAGAARPSSPERWPGSRARSPWPPSSVGCCSGWRARIRACSPESPQCSAPSRW